MAGVQPTKFINYISQFKKLLVTRNNGIISQKFKIDSATDDNYYFSIVNSNNRLIDLTDRKFKIYGSIFDSKDQMHILFYSDDCKIENNGVQMHFKIDTYTSQYMNIVKTNKIIDLTIVEIVNPDDQIPDEEQITQVILRDTAIAYKRPYIENQTPAEILQKVILTSNVPLTGVFGAGQDINLTIGSNGAAFGTGLTQTGDNQLVIGKYNEVDATKAFIIGNGSNDTARSNLFTIDYDGNIVTNGALSATAVYINGQEVGTQVDQKLASTSAWVNETFETKDASTSAYNSLVEEIGDVDSKVDNLSSVMTANYATKVELGAVADAIPSKVSELENDSKYVTSTVVDGYATEQWVLDKQYITSSEIPTDYVTNGQLDEAISSFITIEDVPVYTADNKTLQLNGTEFSIKSLESKISGGVGINVTTTDDVTWITYIGGSSTGGKTYLNGTGLGLSTVSAEDGIYKLYVNEEWLTGKIDAQTSGSFDDISISIDNVSGIVDSNYETLTDQTNYLSGQIDASNEAIGAVSDRVQIIENDYTTSGTVTGWINDLATGAVKTNSDSIEYLSGQISANTASIGELNTSKANLTDFQELTGVVDGINTNLTSNYYTKTEIDTATGAIDERLTAIENDYTTSAQVSGIVTGYNYITSSDIPTQVSVFENDALYVTSSQLTGELNDYTKTTDLNDYLSSGILTGYVTDQQLEEKQYATTGIVDAASSAILSTLTSDYALKTDIPTNDEITGLASAYVDTLNIDTTYATKSEIDDFATSAEVSSIIDLKVTSGYIHDLGFITNSEVEPGTIYSTGFGLAASGDAFNTFYLTGTVLSGSEHISIENNVVSLIGEVGKTYSGTANGGVEVNNTNNTITISSNFLSSNALDSYGDKTWVETNFLSTSYSTTIEGNSQAIEDIQGVTGTFALKADIPADIDDFATSAEVSGIVEGLSTAIRTGLALTSDIPTTVAELTDSGDYALKSELIDTEDVSGVVENMSGAIINGLASVSAIPTAVSELTNDVPYLSTITSADIPTSYVQQSDLAEYAQLSDIPTNSQITGLAKDYVDTLNLATTYAQLSDIPTGLASWESNTNKDYISGLGFITSDDVEPGTVYKTSFGLAASGAANNIFYLTAGVADLNGYDTLALKTDIPTNDEITGLAKDYVDSLDLAGNYASATEFNSVCTALSDAIGLKANSNDVYTKTEADEAFLSSNTFIPVSASQLSGYDDLALKTDLADYITGITFIDGDNNQFASNIFYVSDDLVLTVDEEDENKITLGINGSLAHLEDIPTEATITGYAYNVTTGTVTSSYLTGLGMATTGQIPTKTSDLTNDSEFATTGYVTGYCSAYITSADVLTTLTKVSQLQNDVGYITSSALDDYALTSDIKTYNGGTNIEVTTGNIINFTGTIPSVNGLISASQAETIANEAIASTVTSSYITGLGIATTGQIPTKTSDLTNDSGYITLSDVPAQTVYTNGNGIASATVNDNVQFSLSTSMFNDLTGIANRGANKVLSSTSESGLIWTDNVAGTDIDTVCGMLSSANNNLTISKADNKILFTATGGGSAGNIVGGVGIRVIQDGGNTVISIATASLVAAPSSYTFDFRENGGTTSYDFDYTSYSGNQNLIMSYDGTLPSGVTATQIASGYQFTATSAANVGNNNSTITAYFDAYDITQPASAEVQLTTIGYVSATIAASDTSMTFNNDVASTISALTWTYNGSDTVSASYDSTQIPVGIQVEQNGNSLVFTGTGGSYSANATISLSVTLIANDIIPVTVTVTLVVEGVTLPLSATPLTFKNIAEDSSTATIELYKFGNSSSSSPKVPATYQYSKNDGAWTSYTLGTQIQLTSGQTVAFSGSYFNNGLNDGLKFNTSGSNVLQVYGNIASLDNFRTENYNDVTIHEDAISKGQYAVLFGGANPWSGSDQVGTPCKQLIDASRLYINYLSAGRAMFRQLFAGCSNLSGTIPSFASFTAGGEGSFLGAFAYTKVSGTLDLSNYQGTIDSYEFNNIVRATNITDAIIGGSGFVYNSSMGIGSGWNISNMFYDCSSLTSVQVDFTAWPSNDAARTWMEGVAAAGTFTCPAALDTTTRDSSHVPAGWTVITK